MLQFATNAILSFSSKPITIASRLGISVVVFGILIFCYVLFLKIYYGISMISLTSVICIIIILGGFQIFVIGLIGEYISRIFEESKQRQNFIIDKKINF